MEIPKNFARNQTQIGDGKLGGALNNGDGKQSNKNEEWLLQQHHLANQYKEGDPNGGNLLLMIAPEFEYPKIQHPHLNMWTFRFSENVRNYMRAGHKFEHLFA